MYSYCYYIYLHFSDLYKKKKKKKEKRDVIWEVNNIVMEIIIYNNTALSIFVFLFFFPIKLNIKLPLYYINSFRFDKYNIL